MSEKKKREREESPTNLGALVGALESGRSFEYRYFWGHTGEGIGDWVFSQWWPCSFEVDGRTYTTAEQFMMAGKARLFGDEEMLELILATDDPSSCKKLGRKVQGFDDKRWAAARFELVVNGNLAKFSEPKLREHLLSTGDAILVEASPRDRIWGIGLGKSSEAAKDPRHWRGSNLLGFALVRARALLRAMNG